MTNKADTQLFRSNKGQTCAWEGSIVQTVRPTCLKYDCMPLNIEKGNNFMNISARFT